ncbi:MAG: NAD-dependent epimerase/dehydratase family protein [Candidatus Thorarchaeota archaeon]
MKKALVTGGAGFIGSHLVDRLISDYHVVVLDDLSAGLLENLEQHKGEEGYTFIHGSINKEEDVERALDDVDIVFHFAAQPDVKLSVERPLFDFEINVVGSMLLLNRMKENGIKKIIFASSGGTVYGDTDIMPTPESTAFKPISNYGAAKGAFEMYLSSFAELYDMDAASMRLGNILGPRLTHGVVYDFYMKLKRNPMKLEILGNGLQEKTYLDIEDTINACMTVSNSLPRGFTPINVSSESTIQVKRIAEVIIDELQVQDVSIEYTGERRGWAGDVIKTSLSVSLLKSYGWTPKYTIEESIRKMVRWLVQKFGPI